MDIPKSQIWSFRDAAEQATEFESLLRKNDISIATGSKLEHACLVLHELHSRHEIPVESPWEGLRDDLAEAVGLAQLVRHIVSLQGDKSFPRLLPHLRLLNDGSPAQNTWSSPQDQASNKVLELLVAVAGLPTMSDLDLDDPVRSAGGTNPDVLLTAPNRQRWGFACKVLHGANPKSLFDNYEKGVKQIESSNADTGIVVVNVKNRLPNNRYFPVLRGGVVPTLGTYRDKSIVVADMFAWVNELVGDMVDEIGPDEVWNVARTSKALPGILFVVETAAGILTELGPVPTLLGFLQLAPLEFSPLHLPTRFDGSAMRVLNQLNDNLKR